MHATRILEYLKQHGQKLDAEIAEGLGLPLAEVCATLSGLSARGEISTCGVTRFADDKPVTGMLCRISGSIPPKAPGRKPGVKSEAIS